MVALPPGTILQLMYLRERLQPLQPGNFVEIGPGKGDITDLLLRMGWNGEAYDLSSTTGDHLRNRFAREIAAGQLKVNICDFLDSETMQDADLVISCMVMEHLDDREEAEFVRKAIQRLAPQGRLIGLVPASPRHWNIEDEIAGHYRRYTRNRITELCEKMDLHLQDMAGLTYPLSNLLLPISNFLVRRAEAHKTELDMRERTKDSGHRHVLFKTNFPSFLSILLNERVLAPLNVLQKRFSGSENALVLFFEASPG